MSHPTILLLARFTSSLPIDEVMEVAERRAPEFRALGGLQQKYYLENPATGEVCGLYLWESAEALEEYKQSELRATIAESYQATSEPKVEIFKVLMPLRD